MSFILNALRKSEQERLAKQTETLENSILERDDNVEKRTPGWLVVLVLVNIVFLIFFILSFVIKETPKISVEKHEENNVLVEKVDKGKPENVKQANPAPLKTKLREPSSKLSIADQLTKQQTKKPKTLTKSSRGKPKPENKLNASKHSPVEGPIDLARSVIKPESINQPKNVDERDKNLDSLSFLSELSYEFRRTVPEIEINVFVYSEKENKRFIMIDMKKYLVGQEIASDMRLKEIRMNSIVVKFKNKVFKLKRK